MAQQFGLGKGLSSLIPNKQVTGGAGDDFVSADFEKKRGSSGENQVRGDKYVVEVDIDHVVPNPHQPRLVFDDIKLQELSDSIKQHGVIQPLVVSRSGALYELIAGERRLQASKLAGLKKVPVIVRDAAEKEKLELAIIENVQRHDLNPIEEAKAYQKLMESYQLSQEEVAAKMGKSRSLVANKVRLLALPAEIQRALSEGRITEGHAKAILALPNAEKQRALFELILRGNLTVREAEDKTREVKAASHLRVRKADPDMQAIQDRITGALGTKVRLLHSGKGGRIIIEYYSAEDLGSLLDKIAPEN
ncbi:MAG TPA: ParB/RepB/Spo0J family partition protein [Candidatus Moranbacteria bacterium]|nr:ParB/RepB/Spo0J family partition protein [Candidatus Moranbacteria bacterium]